MRGRVKPAGFESVIVSHVVSVPATDVPFEMENANDVPVRLPEMVEATEASELEEKMPVSVPVASSRMLKARVGTLPHVPDMLQVCARADPTSIDETRTAATSNGRFIAPPSGGDA